MMGLKDQFLQDNGHMAEGWSTDGMGTLICPCGNRVEDDGQCPNGHESPIPI
jgi:hypothetical protein